MRVHSRPPPSSNSLVGLSRQNGSPICFAAAVPNRSICLIADMKKASGHDFESVLPLSVKDSILDAITLLTQVGFHRLMVVANRDLPESPTLPSPPTSQSGARPILARRRSIPSHFPELVNLITQSAILEQLHHIFGGEFSQVCQPE